ncbi:MAG: hypothetical protein WCA10_21770 [Terracidiphilus sp.]
MKKQLENEAIEALRQTLSQISVVKIKEIKTESHRHRGDSTILAHVEIYGHAHRLVCKLVCDCSPIELQRTFLQLRTLHARFPGETTPVLIAPVLTEEAQNLCRDSNTGFLDLEGNARIYLDEVFIVKRSLTHHKTLPPPAEPLPTSETARFAGIA